MATSSSSPLALPPSPAGPPPLATRDGSARDGAAMPLGGDRLQNDTPPMLLGSPPLATRDPARDGSAVQLGGGQLEMDEMDEEGRTKYQVPGPTASGFSFWRRAASFWIEAATRGEAQASTTACLRRRLTGRELI